MQSLWLIIVVFFLIVLVLPLFVKIHISYNFLDNLGTISMYLFFIKIFAFKVKFKGKNIVLISYKNQKEIETAVSEGQMKFLKQLIIELRQKIIVRKMNAYSRIGFNDAYLSAVCTGLFNSIASGVFAFIKNAKKSAKFKVVSEPDYNGSAFTISFYFSISITLVDIIYSILMALALKKRSEKYERS